ncbi:MAG: hypothetical protein L6Q98_07000 [Anaerolineae bacterium]|nr:hypothetical protein [Anaerolineae bacterium]NUQ04820.1 hypothetical protein [Anaerolineae bacterium]
MTFEPYFPDHRHLLGITMVRRARMLPNAATGDVEVARGARVTQTDTVVQGAAPAPFKLIDAARFFDVRPDKVEPLLRVGEGSSIEVGDILAQRGRRRLLAPIDGTVIAVSRGQIVLQGIAEMVAIQAGLNGTVIDVQVGRGVMIEGYGGVVQGVWGNNRQVIGGLRLEPSDGIESIQGGGLEADYRGALVVTRRTLRPLSLEVARDQEIVGIIAPSIAPSLRRAAEASPVAILLVEGFGTMRMSVPVMQFLETVAGRTASLDAATPGALESRRPELIVSVPFDPNDRPVLPNINLTLRPGAQVRLARGDSAGSMGVIVNLPKTPILMDNGLRVPCAQVELATGEKITAPLANLEVTGA